MVLTTNDILYGLLGGVFIALSASIMWIFLGRITGISGIFFNLFSADKTNRGWRLAFILGMVAIGGLANYLINQESFSLNFSHPILLGIAGFLVGFGALLASGCTSGHGICGLSRLSIRSFTAIILFMAAGFVTVTIIRLFFN